MRRTLFCTVAALSLGFGGLLIGCEDTVSKKSEVKTTSDGTTVKKEDKVTRNPDGSTSRTQTVDVDKPDKDKDHDVRIKVDSK